MTLLYKRLDGRVESWMINVMGCCDAEGMMGTRSGEGEETFCKVAPIPSTLLFAPLLPESLLSPSFCNFSRHLANGSWVIHPHLFSLN